MELGGRTDLPQDWRSFLETLQSKIMQPPRCGPALQAINVAVKAKHLAVCGPNVLRPHCPEPQAAELMSPSHFI